MSDLDVPERWSDRLESLVGKRRDLWTVLAVVIGVLAVTLFLRLRTPPPRVAPPSTAPLPQPSSTATSQSTQLFVHVAGAVRRPGLYALPEGKRVADAIDAAGGATDTADVDAINLAELLIDGLKVEVPKRGESTAESRVAPSASAGATPAPSVVDLNTADQPSLETIPGIGPVLAAAIVQHREENGAFVSVDALLDVSGIGPATLESVRPYVTV